MGQALLYLSQGTCFPLRRTEQALQRTGISAPLIDSLPHNAVVARPLKRSVRWLFFYEKLDLRSDESAGLPEITWIY